MKTILLLSFLATTLTWAQSPFERYQKITPTHDGSYYPQRPPFHYPFTVSNKVNILDIDTALFSQDYPSETLNHLEDMYRGFDFLSEYFLYNYPFAVHPHWEFLPYPFLKTVPDMVPGQWISHFDRTPSEHEGVASAQFQRELDELTGTEAYVGNVLTHLKTPESYAEILSRLTLARDHAFIGTYLFQCDQGTEPLIQLIGKKVKEGVRVFIMYDKLGSSAQRGCRSKLEEMGAKVLLRGKLTRIFHEKMYVFDGEYAMVDGQNLIAAGTLSNATNNLFNDVSVGVKGPMATQVGMRFISHWESVRDDMPEDVKALYEKRASADRAQVFKGEMQDGLCRLVTKAPGKHQKQILNLLLHTVRNAKNYLFFNYIDARYKRPHGKQTGEKFMDAVVESANGNPELRIDMLTNGWMIPFEVELPPGVDAPRTFMGRLMLKFIDLALKRPHKTMRVMRENLISQLENNNLHWWAYAQYMHAKTLMADNIWTIIGSYNINGNSENLSYEMVLACHDSKLAEKMQQSIVIDVLNSIPIPMN